MAFSAGCENPCGNDTVRRAASPDESYSVITYNRDCGTGSAVVTHLQLQKSGHEEGLDPERSFGSIDGADSLVVAWLSTKTVMVTYQAKRTASVGDTTIGPIDIKFRRRE